MKKIIKFSLIVIYILSFNIIVNAAELPKLYITGDLSNMVDKEDVRNVQINYTSSTLNFNCYATFKLQGQHSLNYPKKNYNIKLYKDASNTQKEYVDFKWGSFYKYTLKANWTDGSHARNIIVSDIAGEINKKFGFFKNTPNNGAIDGFPIEIYVNDTFHGLYTLNLNKEYMFEDNTNHDYTLISNQTDYGMRDIKKETSKWENFEVEVGDENQETLDNFNRLLYFIHNSTDQEFKKDINKYINLDALLNYYCVVRFAGLWDNLGRNLYFLTYDGNVWYPILYDLDYSFASHYTSSESQKKINDFIAVFPLWSKLEKNFGNEIYARYQELRGNILTKSNVVNKFDTFYNQIPSEVINKDNSLWYGVKQFSSSQLRKYLTSDIPAIDKYIATLRIKNPLPEIEQNDQVKPSPNQPNTNQPNGNNTTNNNGNNNNNNTGTPTTPNNSTTNKPNQDSTEQKPTTEQNSPTEPKPDSPDNNEISNESGTSNEEKNPNQEDKQDENIEEELSKEDKNEQKEENIIIEPNKQKKEHYKLITAIIVSSVIIIFSIIFILRKKNKKLTIK